MEQQERVEHIEKFVRGVILGELGKINASGALYTQFVLMGQAVEVLGALLDNKPVKARGQAAKRFERSINFLFGGAYRVVNTGNFLYDKLRNQMVHSFIPSRELLLYADAKSAPAGHLQRSGDSVVLIADVFYADICAAGERLLRLIKSGDVKAKNISF